MPPSVPATITGTVPSSVPTSDPRMSPPRSWVSGLSGPDAPRPGSESCTRTGLRLPSTSSSRGTPIGCRASMTGWSCSMSGLVPPSRSLTAPTVPVSEPSRSLPARVVTRPSVPESSSPRELVPEVGGGELLFLQPARSAMHKQPRSTLFILEPSYETKRRWPLRWLPVLRYCPAIRKGRSANGEMRRPGQVRRRNTRPGG